MAKTLVQRNAKLARLEQARKRIVARNRARVGNKPRDPETGRFITPLPKECGK